MDKVVIKLKTEISELKIFNKIKKSKSTANLVKEKVTNFKST